MVRGFGEIIPVLDFDTIASVIDEIAGKYDIPRLQAIATAPIGPRPPRPAPAYGNSIADRYGLRIEDIGYPINARFSGDEIIGICPLVPTQNHVQNYRINPSKNTWQCWSTNTGGDVVAYFACLHGIARLEDFTKGARPLEGRMGEVFRALRDAGYRDRTVTRINVSGWCKS